MKIILAMLIMALGFCLGAGYSQWFWRGHYEPRIEWLSKELEGTRKYMMQVIWEKEFEYLHYLRK